MGGEVTVTTPYIGVLLCYLTRPKKIVTNIDDMKTTNIYI